MKIPQYPSFIFSTYPLERKINRAICDWNIFFSHIKINELSISNGFKKVCKVQKSAYLCKVDQWIILLIN